MMLGNFSSYHAYAEEKTTEAEQKERSKSKTATNLDENYDSVVTLGIPSAEYKESIDVVIVADASTSSDVKAISAQASELIDSLSKMKNLEVKAAVVIFGGYTDENHNVILAETELGKLSDEDVLNNMKTIVTNPEYDNKSIYPNRSGSNLHAGVYTAKEKLDADTSVENQNKYMIILSDGGARMWYDTENKEPMSHTIVGSGSNPVWWNTNSDHNEMRYKNGELDFRDVWERAENGDPDKYSMNRTDYLAALEKIKNKEATYEDYPEIASTKVVNDLLSDYFTNCEAGTYYAAKELLAAAENYNVIMVTYPYASGSIGRYVESFKAWMSEKENVTRYEYNSSDDNSAEIFKDIHDRLVYLVDAGSEVVDEIGEGLSFKNDIDTFKLTVNNEEYDKKKLESEDNAYAFLDKEGNEAFVLRYFADGTTAHEKEYGECLVLEIKQAITYDDPVRLTYTVHLDEPETADGEYGFYDRDGSQEQSEIYTNKVATLFPVDTLGKEGASEDFPKPTVSYKITSVSGTKTWKDGDDQDGKRPESITVELYKGNEKVASTEVKPDDAGKWSYEFTNLRLLWNTDKKQFEDKSLFSVKEVLPDGTVYTSTVEGFDITNKYEPEVTEVTVTKEWDDEDNQDGIRPETVKVALKAAGETVKELTLSEENKWTEKVEGLPKFKAGKEIKYTVEETEVPEGYEASVEGFTVTNTHEPETVTVSVVKEWVGDEKVKSERPDKLHAIVYADGEAEYKADLNEKNDWKYDFIDLPKYKDGKEIVYTVDEEDVPEGYKKTVEQLDTYSFKITNKFEDENVPDTGDYANLTHWVTLLCVSLIGASVVAVDAVKKKKEE